MNFKLELPADTILVNRTELIDAIQEVVIGVQEENASEEIMTIQEAAEYLKVSVPTIRKLISFNELPYFQRGQVIRFNRWDIKEWIRTNSRQ
ncbi:helix-turn-helix domain-containing protein [Priestia endophytica]